MIVDDHPMMREGLCSIINREPDLTVCCEAENARKALAMIEKTVPDLALVDITMPEGSGLELIKDLIALRPKLPVLVISMHDESLYAERTLRAGAKGYINKHQPPGELLKAIRQVISGQIYTSRGFSQTLLQRINGKVGSARSNLEILTDRETEVFQMVGQGKSVKEIAQQLRMNAKTVSVHSANIRKKLGLNSSAQLILLAIRSQNSA